MRRVLITSLCVVGLLAGLSRQASAQIPQVAAPAGATSTLITCLADQTSGRDRKDLAKWVFLAMGAHPDNKAFLVPGLGQATEEVNRTAANLFMRLLSDACPTQVRAAAAEGGSRAIQAAFATFGQLAMQELMTNTDVTTAMSGLDKYIDQERLLRVLRPPQEPGGAASPAPAPGPAPKP